MSIKIKNPRRNKLFNDGERKECGRCHKIKSHEYFRKRQGRLHSVCEKCRQIIKGITNFKKQIKVITDLFEKQCLCKNCHSLVHSVNFEQFYEEIFESDTSSINLVEEKYLIIKENIHNFSFKNNYIIKK